MSETGFSGVVDARRENALAAFFEQRYGCKLVHLGRFSEIDWIANTLAGQPFRLIEAKRRSNPSGLYGDVFLSYRKYVSLMLAAQGLGIPAMFAVWFADGKIYSSLVNKINASLSAIVCRNDHRASNDDEPAIKVTLGSMTLEGGELHLPDWPSPDPAPKPSAGEVARECPDDTATQLLAASLVGRGSPWPFFDEMLSLGAGSPVDHYARRGKILASFFELIVRSERRADCTFVRISKRRWDAFNLLQARTLGVGIKIVVQFADCKKMLDLNRLRGISDAVSGGEAPMEYPNQPPRVWWPELSASGNLDVLIPVDLFHDLPKVEKS